MYVEEQLSAIFGVQASDVDFFDRFEPEDSVYRINVGPIGLETVRKISFLCRAINLLNLYNGAAAARHDHLGKATVFLGKNDNAVSKNLEALLDSSEMIQRIMQVETIDDLPFEGELVSSYAL